MTLALPRILITGANGFVGRHLITALRERFTPREATLFAATHGAPSQAWPREVAAAIAQAPMDLEDAASVTKLLSDVQPTHVVHLAARASGADTDRGMVFAVNVEGTRRLLTAAASLSVRPRTLVVSTGYVYGNTDPTRPATETDPVAPAGRYGAYTDSKMEMERLAAGFAEFATVVRPFSHTGPGQAPAFAAPAFARQLARMERGEQAPELLVGNIEARRDLLDVRDVARAYVLLLEHGEPGETYNVASGAPVSMHAVLDGLRSLCSVETTVRTDPSRLRPADIACSTGDARKLREATGWAPRYTLDQTLLDTLSFWRAEEA